MINSKTTKPSTSAQLTEERLFKMLESIDWKLWEMMNMMKQHQLGIGEKKPKSRNTIKANGE